jgi:putative ABC transport system substrate-binding protein
MRRREVIPLLLGATACPLALSAQQATRLHRVAFIVTTSPVSELVGDDPPNQVARAFLQGLRSLGYVEGQNLVMSWIGVVPKAG